MLGGIRHEAGLRTFAGSEIKFDLKGLYDKFTALVGMDSRSDEDATIDFVVTGDGRELWRSSPLKKTDAPNAVEVNITGVHELALHAIGANDERHHSQADWAEPEVSKAAR